MRQPGRMSQHAWPETNGTSYLRCAEQMKCDEGRLSNRMFLPCHPGCLLKPSISSYMRFRPRTFYLSCREIPRFPKFGKMPNFSTGTSPAPVTCSRLAGSKKAPLQLQDARAGL